MISRFRVTKCRTKQKTTKCGANCAKVRYSYTNWNCSWLGTRENSSTCADWIRSIQKWTAHLSAIKRGALAMTFQALANLNSEPLQVRKPLSEVVEIESLTMNRVWRIQKLSPTCFSLTLEILWALKFSSGSHSTTISLRHHSMSKYQRQISILTFQILA